MSSREGEVEYGKTHLLGEDLCSSDVPSSGEYPVGIMVSPEAQSLERDEPVQSIEGYLRRLRVALTSPSTISTLVAAKAASKSTPYG